MILTPSPGCSRRPGRFSRRFCNAPLSYCTRYPLLPLSTQLMRVVKGFLSPTPNLSAAANKRLPHFGRTCRPFLPGTLGRYRLQPRVFAHRVDTLAARRRRNARKNIRWEPRARVAHVGASIEKQQDRTSRLSSLLAPPPRQLGIPRIARLEFALRLARP